MLGRMAACLVALGTLAALGCQRDAGGVRGPLLETIADMEGITRDEIAILEDLRGRPDSRSRHEEWRRRLEEARAALDRLADLRAEVRASTEADLAGGVGRRALSVVEEIRRAADERLQLLRTEFGGRRIAGRRLRLRPARGARSHRCVSDGAGCGPHPAGRVRADPAPDTGSARRAAGRG